MSIFEESICETEQYEVHYFKRRGFLISDEKYGEFYKKIIQTMEGIEPLECYRISETIKDLMLYRYKANGGSF